MYLAAPLCPPPVSSTSHLTTNHMKQKRTVMAFQMSFTSAVADPHFKSKAINLFIIPSSECAATAAPLSHLLELKIIWNYNKKERFLYLQPFSPLPSYPPLCLGNRASIKCQAATIRQARFFFFFEWVRQILKSCEKQCTSYKDTYKWHITGQIVTFYFEPLLVFPKDHANKSIECERTPSFLRGTENVKIKQYC